MPKIKLDGDKNVRERLRRLAIKYPDVAAAAVYHEAEQIMTKSKRDFVPVDDGPLRSSGHVGKPNRSGRTIRVELSYGGVAAPYALAVHEHPSQYDPPSWRGKGTQSMTPRLPPTPGFVTFHPQGRGPKYLERPLMEAVDGMTKRLADKIRVMVHGI